MLPRLSSAQEGDKKSLLAVFVRWIVRFDVYINDMRLRLLATLSLITSTIFAALVLGPLLLPPSQAAASMDPAARVIELTNYERQKAGLAPVVANPALAQSAQSYSEVLAGGPCWAHTCGPTPSLEDRIRSAGDTHWSKLGTTSVFIMRKPKRGAAWRATPPLERD